MPGSSREDAMSEPDLPALLASLPRRLSQVAFAGAASQPDAVALLEGDRTWTWRELGVGVAALALRLPAHEHRRKQIAARVYTSGTTGAPKGVMLTHHNLLFIARTSSTLRLLSPAHRVYGALPISHVYGLASVCLGSLCAGASLLLESRYTPPRLAAALAQGGLTVLQGVPAMYAKLLEFVGRSGQRIVAPNLASIYAGGSPLDPALKSAVETAFGLTLHNGYGITECAATVTQTRLDEPRADTSVGRPI